MPPVCNVAAYRFVPLADVQLLREQLFGQAARHGLLGTILLAEEGINLFLAAEAHPVHEFLRQLQMDERFAGLDVKESWSASQPFRKLRVRIKREIIRMNHPAIQPAAGRASSVDAPTLKRWLDAGHDDAGRALVLLDTRNAFEVEQGRFDGAIEWGLAKFSDFPRALAAHAEELRGKTVVTYCTGGIRCEKAALLMGEVGIDHVHQLDGGILKYFEQTDGAHFRGNCFVFDEREALDAALSATRI